MTTVLDLVRHALRRLRRSPGYALPVLISLSLGIGLNTAVFAVMDDVVRRPLPFADESSLRTLGLRTANSTSPDATPSVQWIVFQRDLIAWREQSRTVEGFGVYVEFPQNVSGPAGGEFLQGSAASANLLEVLGVQPRLGRWFTADEASTKARVVVLSHELWRRQFAEDPAALGKVLRIRQEPWTVIGVMPKGVAFPPDAEYWIPREGMLADENAIVRVRAGIDPDQVARELTALAPSVVNLRKGSRAAEIVTAPLRDHLYGAARPVLRLLTAAAALLLLIACANIANLSLARTLERQRELAVRLTLGASKRSLVALILTENLVLAVAGGAVGILLAVWGSRAVVALGPEEISRVRDIGVGTSAVAFGVMVAIGAAFLVSVAPVLAASDRGIQPLLTQGGSRVARGRASRRVRYALVATQLAVALLLITSAGLLIRSVQRLTRGDRLGFTPENVVVATVPMSAGNTLDEGWRQRFVADLRERVARLPGVRSVGIGPAPLVGGRGEGIREGFSVILYEEDTIQGERRPVLVFVKHVDPGYQATYGLHLRAGRWLEATDGPGTAPVAVLSASAAKRYFPDANALGRTLELETFRRMQMTPPRIVGIVDDVLQRDLTMDASPEIFLPIAQQRATSMPTIAVRFDGPTAPVVAAMRSVLRDIDPQLVTSRLQTMESIVAASLKRHSFLLLLLGIFAALGLTLSAIGLYAVISYLVTQRTLEIGIRMALGAQRSDVFSLVLREGVMLASIGLAIGIPAALGLSRLLSSFLFEIRPHDLTTFAVAPVGLALVALCATFLPARKAAAVDPARAMRAE